MYVRHGQSAFPADMLPVYNLLLVSYTCKMESSKKIKSSNFSKQEMDVLVSEVEARQDILFGKLGMNLTSEMKRGGWNEVTEKVNQVSGGEMRTEKSVKKKWTDMASNLKKKEAVRRREMCLTGGGTAAPDTETLTDVEIKVVGMLATESIEGVDGGCDVGLDVNDSVKKEVSVSAVKGSTERTKQKDKDNGIEELARVEKRRLEIEEERLGVEKRRLEIEEKRLKLEEERWLFERSRLTESCVLFADE